MKLALGTVQFGLDYGITNASGIVCPNEAQQIVNYAFQHNVKVLDTAEIYGKSQKVLGRILAEKKIPCSMVTKISFEHDQILSKDLVDNIFFRCLSQLKQKKIYGLLAHNIENLYKDTDHILRDKLRCYRSQYYTEKIGVSIYSPQEARWILEFFPECDIIQLPLNVLDQRFLEQGLLQELKERGVEIHVRSVFLQGILLDSAKLAVRKVNFSLNQHLDWYFNKLCLLKITPLEAALGFIKSIPYVDYIVVGATTVEQFKEIIDAYYKIIHYDRWDKFAYQGDVHALDPRSWKISEIR